MPIRLLVLMLLVGCTTTTVMHPDPCPVHTKVVYREVPAKRQVKLKIPEVLFVSCRSEDLTVLDNEELVRVFNVNKLAMLECEDRRVKAIKELTKLGLTK